ncbi:SPOR domain-containing protein [Sphingobium sp. BYY-5]|uniref:SPOR domain-containing protein n=1 Tax=Sphingobium sp. BYY-5 TaxID=2926400 RepID=UPI001FA70A0B|nr:SPOR domain-containing protein [Sphingobium sp. BYY-5]MCI4588919.1 SPOR domain-containing protein [Sphingobium sp. BYY-5]
MKHNWGTMAAGALLGLTVLSLSGPVLANVKTGVDAWQQGDYAKAIGEWRPLADSGDPDAQFNMGQAYKLGRGVQPDLSIAMDWYRKAAAQGHMRAEDNLGLLMFQQGDRAGAMPYLQHASMRGEPRAQYIVGTALFNGDLVGKDWVRAYALMSRAAAQGLSQASTSLTQMDKYIPEDQRRQGLALAANMEQQGKNAGFAASDPAPVRTTPAPVRTAALPPSTPSQPPAAPKPATAQPAPPRPAPQVAAAPPKPVASGNWRVQLGAFGEEGNARALWSRLTGKVSGLSTYHLFLVKTGAITRLQAGPIASSGDAERLCTRIKAAGADCIPKKI